MASGLIAASCHFKATTRLVIDKSLSLDGSPAAAVRDGIGCGLEIVDGRRSLEGENVVGAIYPASGETM